jgi:hypothetical protein
MDSEVSLELVNKYLNLKWCIEHCISPWKYDSADSCLYLAINDIDLVEKINNFLSKRLEGRVRKLVFEYRARDEIESYLGLIKEEITQDDTRNNEYEPEPMHNNINSKNLSCETSASIYWDKYINPLSDAISVGKNFRDLAKISGMMIPH